jgi:hypothetical protein
MELRFWIDPETELPHILDHGVTSKTPTKQKEMTAKKIQTYPAGWAEDRGGKLVKHYDNQTADEQIAEALATAPRNRPIPIELAP